MYYTAFSVFVKGPKPKIMKKISNFEFPQIDTTAPRPIMTFANRIRNNCFIPFFSDMNETGLLQGDAFSLPGSVN